MSPVDDQSEEATGNQLKFYIYTVNQYEIRRNVAAK